MPEDAFRRRDKLEMGRRYGVPVVNPAAGSVPSVVIPERGDVMAGPKADRDGAYEFEGKPGRFRIKKGDPLPEGARLIDEPAAPAAKPAATAKATGPSETTKGRGPSEKA